MGSCNKHEKDAHKIVRLLEQTADRLSVYSIPHTVSYHMDELGRAFDGFDGLLTWLRWHKPATADRLERKYKQIIDWAVQIDTAIRENRLSEAVTQDCSFRLHFAVPDMANELRSVARLLEEDLKAEPQNKTVQGKSKDKGQHKKITKLTDFIRDCCEDTTSISSKANRIHEFVKKRKIMFMPKPVNRPERNETKLYDEEELRQIWPKLKVAIKSLPNLKD